MINGVIFDADGTLIDSMGIWNEAGFRYLKSLNINAEPTLSKILFDMSMQEGCKYIKNHYNLNCTASEVESGMLSIISRFYKEEVQLKKGVRCFLDELNNKGISMCVATSSDKELLKDAFSRLNINCFFDKIFSCKELGTNKREPYIYQQAAKYMKTAPNKTVVIEDTLFAIRSAKSAGFITAAVSDNASLNDKSEIIEAADCFMQDFTDFTAFWNFVSEK